MKDKVTELKEILEKKKQTEATEDEETQEIESVELSEDEQISQDLENTKVKLAEKTQEYLRLLAEFENYKKRLNKEKEDIVKFANESLLEDLFPVLDNLEMTMSHVSEDKKSDPLVSGVELTLKQFIEVLKKQGLEEISGEGEKFDPNLQEAMGTEARDDLDNDAVATVHRKGYKLKDRVIRAALVTVNKV